MIGLFLLMKSNTEAKILSYYICFKFSNYGPLSRQPIIKQIYLSNVKQLEVKLVSYLRLYFKHYFRQIVDQNPKEFTASKAMVINNLFPNELYRYYCETPFAIVNAHIYLENPLLNNETL